MSSTIEQFDPASWHDSGIVRSLPATPVRRRPRRGARNSKKAAVVATFALAASSVFVADEHLSLPIQTTAVSRNLEATRVWPGEADVSTDLIDPSEWGQLVSTIARLPRDYSVDPDDVEPFV